MSTSLSIKGKTQANDAVTSTINYVNPAATDAQLVSLATAFNSLTTNTVADITRVDKNSLINTVEKLPRNASLEIEGATVTSIKASEIGTSIQTEALLDIVYADQAGEFEEISVGATGDVSGYYFTWFARTQSGTESGTGALAIFRDSTVTIAPATINIYIPEDSTYQAATLTLTITAD